MIRAQVYLTEEQARAIDIRALQERRPKAQVLRELVDRGLALPDKGQQQTVGEGLRGLAALGEKLHMTGPTDLSTNHDDYLYGNKQ